MNPTAPLPFSLRQLQYLLAVADQGGFRHAADACHVAQPSLSAQVAQVEEALGVVIFDRSRRPIGLTDAGQIVVAQARRAVEEAWRLVAAATPLADPLAGTLRVGIIPTMSPYLLPALVPALTAALPRLALRWTEDKTPTLVAELHKGDLDAAVLALEADLGELETRALATDPFLLATAPGHPLATRAAAPRLEDLRAEPVFVLDDGHCFRDQVLDVCQQSGALEAAFRATSLPTLTSLVVSGAGITLLPAMAEAVENRRSTLATRAFAGRVPGRTIALAWRRGAPLEASIRAVGDALATALADPAR